jgi:hypothetical protein
MNTLLLDNMKTLVFSGELNLLAASSEIASIPYRNKPFCTFPVAKQREMYATEFMESLKPLSIS